MLAPGGMRRVREWKWEESKYKKAKGGKMMVFQNGEVQVSKKSGSG